MIGPIFSYVSTRTTSDTGAMEKNVEKEYQMYERNFQDTSKTVGNYIHKISNKKAVDSAYLNFIVGKTVGNNVGEVNKLKTQLNNKDFVQEYAESIMKIMQHSNKRLNRVGEGLSSEAIDVDTSLDRLNVSHSDMIRKMSRLFKQMLDTENHFEHNNKEMDVHVSFPVSLKDPKKNSFLIGGENHD
ncbi:hypothetical protein [Levilactobacillus wangkuiensis]|uniref:hypothetical protein n=1 Tax=Levilactobacillus wangkuiensis TaxID=2799566 RepID=UPI0019425CD4|nr:hypothetical protein [Levilactobacillus wangkuiensis]